MTGESHSLFCLLSRSFANVNDSVNVIRVADFYCAVKSLNMMLHGGSQHSANFSSTVTGRGSTPLPWVSEWHSATFSTVCERESRPQCQFSVCSRFANHERISANVNHIRTDLCVSRGSSTPGRHAHSWAQLSWERNESVLEVISFTSFS